MTTYPPSPREAARWRMWPVVRNRPWARETSRQCRVHVDRGRGPVAVAHWECPEAPCGCICHVEYARDESGELMPAQAQTEGASGR